MPWLSTVLVAVGASALTIWAAARQIRARRWPMLALVLVVAGTYVELLHALFGFPDLEHADSMGPEDAFLPLVLALYVCMVAGMVAEYLFHYLDAAAGLRGRFDVGGMVKTVLVSPLIFIPLVASLQSANVDPVKLNAPRLMLFLVAFENGFLWRGYFSRKLAGEQEKSA